MHAPLTKHKIRLPIQATFCLASLVPPCPALPCPALPMVKDSYGCLLC